MHAILHESSIAYVSIFESMFDSRERMFYSGSDTRFCTVALSLKRGERVSSRSFLMKVCLYSVVLKSFVFVLAHTIGTIAVGDCFLAHHKTVSFLRIMDTGSCVGSIEDKRSFRCCLNMSFVSVVGSCIFLGE